MKLKELRENKQILQKDIAKALNLKQNSYSLYESGKTKATEELLIKLANYFNVSLDYLCDRPFNNNIGYLTQKQKELTIKISELNDFQCDQVNAILETLKLTSKKETKNYTTK